MTARSRPAVLKEIRGKLSAERENRRLGKHQLAAEHANHALSLAESVGHPGLKASALSALAINELRLGDVEKCASHAHQALAFLKRARDAGERTQVLCTLVMAYIDMGLPGNALVHATEAIQAARIARDPSLMSWALNRAGLTHQAVGDSARGEAMLKDALQIAREIDGTEEMFSALNNLADHLLIDCDAAQGETRQALIARALAYATEALTLAQAAGNAHREAVCLDNLAVANVKSGQYDTALGQLSRLEDIALAQGYRVMQVTALSHRALLESRRGEFGAAIHFYELALAAAHENDDRIALPSLRQGLYESYKLHGDAANALRHHEELLALERARLMQRADRQARLLLNRIEVEQAQAAVERARLDAEVQRLHSARLESENQKLAAEALELGKSAFEDQLTGLANRRRIQQELPAHLARAVGREAELSVAAIDLDHFKQVNDHFGHSVGDDVLRAVARIFIDNTRATDLLVRMGGEEFLVLFVGTPLRAATEICERLRRSVEAHDWDCLAPGLHVTISIGLCDATDSDDVRTLLERADASLYAAKRSGRNRVEVAAALAHRG